MKKILVTILSLVYLTSSTGATLHLHYCMDKLVAWSFGGEKANKKSCPYCGMAKTGEDKHNAKQSNGCCKDEHKQVKVDKDQKTAESGLQIIKIFDDSKASRVHLSDVNFPRLAIENFTANAPPYYIKVALFVRNSNFRI